MSPVSGTSTGRLSGIALVAIALTLAGWSATSSVALPAPEELVPNTVALISDVPARDGTITRPELRHAVIIQAAGAGLRTTSKPGDRGYERLQREALEFQLEGVWIRGEAAEKNISVTPREVAGELARIKKESFKTEAEYRKFLRESRYTRRDVRERVEIQLLSLELQEWLLQRFSREGKTSRAEEQRGFAEFIDEFNEKWKSRTVCGPDYAVDRCSNGPLPARQVRRASADKR